MTPLSFPLLADENVQPDAIAALIGRGKDVRSVHDEGLTGQPDSVILRRSHELGRVVVTHDSDFGRLAVLAREAFVGIIYLRPGHIAASFVLETLDAIERGATDVEPPFILVAERREGRVRIRVRSLVRA
jgi:predicted nuclease of predicted toxin-antitoxin system